jgi:hypothetical protein
MPKGIGSTQRGNLKRLRRAKDLDHPQSGAEITLGSARGHSKLAQLQHCLARRIKKARCRADRLRAVLHCVAIYRRVPTKIRQKDADRIRVRHQNYCCSSPLPSTSLSLASVLNSASPNSPMIKSAPLRVVSKRECATMNDDSSVVIFARYPCDRRAADRSTTSSALRRSLNMRKRRISSKEASWPARQVVCGVPSKTCGGDGNSREKPLHGCQQFQSWDPSLCGPRQGQCGRCVGLAMQEK